MTQQDTPTKNYVRIPFSGEAFKVIRLSTQNLDFVYVYLAKRDPVSRLLLWKSSAIETRRVTPR